MVEFRSFDRFVRARPFRWLLGPAGALLVPSGAALAAPACAHTRCPSEQMVEDTMKVDAELRRIASESPDSVVGLLIRLERPLEASEQQELRDAGLTIGTVAGTVLTARARVCEAVAAAAHPAIRHVQLARAVPPPSPVPGKPRP
jgi:hypothetical protein